MRILGLITVGLVGLSLGGCSQISSAFKKKPHYHTADGMIVYTGDDAGLRTTPAQTYQFADQDYDVEIYDSASVDANSFGYSGGTEYVYADGAPSDFGYSGYDVELYASPIAAPYSDPRETEFVKLNGDPN